MSRNLDLLQATYQRAGRDGVDAVVDLLDPPGRVARRHTWPRRYRKGPLKP